MSLFVLASKDGWVNIMYTGLDAVGVDQQVILSSDDSFTSCHLTNEPVQRVNYHVFRTLAIARTVVKAPVISLPSYALCTGSESLNASNTSSFHLPKKFSQLPNLRTFITSSPLNVLAVLALYPSLLINSFYLFVNLIPVPVPPFSTHLFLHPSLLPLLIYHSAHP